MFCSTVKVHVVAYWVIRCCNPVKWQRVSEGFFLPSRAQIILAVKMETVSSFETSKPTENTTRCHIYIIGPTLPRLRGFYFTHKRTHVHRCVPPVRLLLVSDQHITQAATYTANNKHKRGSSMTLAGFERAITTIGIRKSTA